MLQWPLLEPATLTKPLLTYSLMQLTLPQGLGPQGLSERRDTAFCPQTPWEELAQISTEACRPFRREAYSEELMRKTCKFIPKVSSLHTLQVLSSYVCPFLCCLRELDAKFKFWSITYSSNSTPPTLPKVKVAPSGCPAWLAAGGNLYDLLVVER